MYHPYDKAQVNRKKKKKVRQIARGSASAMIRIIAHTDRGFLINSEVTT